MEVEKDKLVWRVNTPQLLKEILENNETQILRIPLSIFSCILDEIGERCIQINDPKLNALMCRLAIYDVSDPYSENYDAKVVEETIKLGYRKVEPATPSLDTDWGEDSIENGRPSEGWAIFNSSQSSKDGKYVNQVMMIDELKILSSDNEAVELSRKAGYVIGTENNPFEVVSYPKSHPSK